MVRPSPAPSFGASRGMLAVGGAILALVVVALVVRHGRAGAERTNNAISRTADSAPAPATPTPASARSPTADRSTSSKPSVRAAAQGSARSDRAVAAPAPAGPGIRRYAQTWVNVRGDRARSAPAVGLLNPGDAVTVDSLVRGWYRVLVDGRTLGYVHRSMLDVSRPE
jgi:hypothetical protein